MCQPSKKVKVKRFSLIYLQAPDFSRGVADSSNKLSDSEKSSSVKIVEEWFREDKAMGTLKEELLKISLFFKDIFVELGLD